jgi:hypothetical protein
MEDVGKFNILVVYLTAIWYILWLFGIFFPFWCVVTRKIWQPWSHSQEYVPKFPENNSVPRNLQSST